MKFNHRILRSSFSTAQVARLTGLSARQLDHWDRLGFFSPSLASAKGYGSKRRYSFGDVVRLRVAGRLRSAGLGLKEMRRVVETLQRLDPSRPDVAGARLLVAQGHVLWARTDSELVDLLHGGQLVLVFPVDETVEDVARAVESLAREAEGGLAGAVSVRRHA